MFEKESLPNSPEAQQTREEFDRLQKGVDYMYDRAKVRCIPAKRLRQMQFALQNLSALVGDQWAIRVEQSHPKQDTTPNSNGANFPDLAVK